MRLPSGRARQIGRGNNMPLGFYGVGALADIPADVLNSVVSDPTGSLNVNTTPVVVASDPTGNEIGVAPAPITALPSSPGTGPIGVTVAATNYNTPTSTGSSSWLWLAGAAGFLIFVMAAGGRR